MTLDELKASTSPTVNASAVAGILGCNPQFLRVMARRAPDKLGFPVIVMGTRVRIPRLPFIHFLLGGGEPWSTDWERV